MNTPFIKLLVARTAVALGSLALVEKELLEIHTVFDNLLENSHHEDTRGQEENSDSKFFISPPLEVYDGTI